ncbi:GDP-mannose 4,6-dehydratase [Gammaproteobacteria bacterium]|nr:GDP-mannose 4,6-dehydratase [Gammaproteobacteria bacterium]
MTCLITGGSGQDAPYLAKIALRNGMTVCCQTRQSNPSLTSYEYLKIQGLVTWVTLDLINYASVEALIRQMRPTCIIHLSGQSSVGQSWRAPRQTIQSHVISTLNILEAVRSCSTNTKVFVAGSCESFTDTRLRITKDTMHEPRSPYAAAKAAMQVLCRGYRENYDVWVSTGYFSNHESEFRNKNFVTQKIVSNAREILAGRVEKVALGSVSVTKDWGLAEEYMEAVMQLLLLSEPHDAIIATGHSQSLQQFAEAVFEFYGLTFGEHVEFDPTLTRKGENERAISDYDVESLARLIGWKAETVGRAVPIALCEKYEQFEHFKTSSISS